MPELPEVETIVRQLRSKLLDLTITKLDIKDKKVIDSSIKKSLPARIEDISRRGKSIIFKLDKGNLLIQLRMTGHLYHPQIGDDRYKKYLSGIFRLDNGSFFTFNEIRRFGSVKFFTNKQLQQKLSKLGPEPLSLKDKEFVEIISKYPNANLKNKLLDQRTIVGIGNIYAQEALYHSGINPKKLVKDVSKEKLILLNKELKNILQLAIQNNGTTVNNFSHLDGTGDFQNFLTVYGKTNCPQKHAIEKINISGRGTSFCPKCQK